MASSTNVTGILRTVGARLATVPVALATLALVSLVFFVLSSTLFGLDWGLLISGLVALALLTIVGYTSVATDWSLTLAAAGYLFVLACLSSAFVLALWLIVLVTSTIVVSLGLALSIATFVAFGVTTGLTLTLLAAIRYLGPSADWTLTLRMATAVCMLALVTIGFLATLWSLVFVLALFVTVSLSLSVALATVGTTALAIYVCYLEYTQVSSIEERTDATPVTPEEYPQLYALTTRIASQLDVPTPTIAIAERRTPEAMVVGFRPSTTHLVLSHGTIAALDADELEAVVAHELAHVANRDSIVMTVVSLPVVLADGLRARARGEASWLRQRTSDAADTGDSWSDGELTEAEIFGENGEWLVYPDSTAADEDGDEETDNSLPVVVITTVTVAVSRVIIAVLSRARETAADRTAAEVTGSPSALAWALRTLDEQIDRTPRADLREVADVSALSILPVDPVEVDVVMLGPEGDVTPSYWSIRRPIQRLKHRLLRTHPPTERRLEELAALEGRFERERETT
ncbi:M48 family metalloprotease [Halobacteria archaeon AArc-m2/3/4]|uniref:M48 family metalloprotease n=2 Tax=Natronoglomus mannanivorans TaxID=2979990 RepID=A0ABT2QGW8_9EURY|nr:M48 family metalloprotease [Halobacteria archaeon AArc-m2/3/4]